MNSLIYILIIFLILMYLLLIDDEVKKEEEVQQEKIDVFDDALVYLAGDNNYYLCINESTSNLYLDNENGEKFKIIKKNHNKIGLQSLSLGYYLMINYTSFSNNTYDVNISGCNLDNNATQLKLVKNKKNKKYYIKFYNDYYLCVDINKNLFSSKDKSKIFYFRFTQNITL